ncbi:B12-binding domain-containing radical SAM protein [Novipirellula artificiosorum]|uniref:Biotin synthase n=1 Tax=Novipirellula artificiosorum TaxID=2528016 RepID=A0A5C6D9Z3_9BACT|nr:cobalamin-dependent protein [Novipirellula artificiosorum]TWU33700.1 biotin synthase [Novipirellula artificiosorum]
MSEMTKQATQPAVQPKHPLGSDARVLLTSVFGPYAVDDGAGSRLINPMELYHNQVTRVQQAYSLRTFQRSWGLMLIQVNLKAPCTLLDFPSEKRFLEEIKNNRYDVVGISSIQTNLIKVRKMCRLIRKHLPDAQIIIGGHIANFPELRDFCDFDHVVRGDGVCWMRDYLSQDTTEPLKHPQVIANIGSRIMGVNLKNHPGDIAATLIPSAGCPMGCNFCSTSAMFGGKGKYVKFFESGEQLFQIMCQLEKNLNTSAFFVMDENFLVDKKRALGLLELMEQHNKPWSLYLFSSANVLQQYTMEQLVALGVSWVWMGLEGKGSQYTKLAGTDTLSLVRQLQSHGIRVLGSSIIGLEEHTPENIGEAIDHAVLHNSEFHQFMLYTPIPGTPLFAEHEAAGTLLDRREISIPDIHGQLRFNFHHPHIKDGQETEFLLQAFHRDFEVNGPSVIRIVRTNLRAWKRYRDHADKRIRERFAHESKSLPIGYAGVLWATRRAYQDDPVLAAECSKLLGEMHEMFGLKSRLAAPIAGRYLYRKLRQEQQRLEDGWTYEPPVFYEKNSKAGPDDALLVEGAAAAAS